MTDTSLPNQQQQFSSYVPIQQVSDNQPIRATCFHPSGQAYVVGGLSKTLRICKYPSQDTIDSLINESQDSDYINQSQYFDSRQEVSLLPVEPEILFTCLHIHCGSIYCAAFNRAGNLLATGSNDTIVHLIKYNSENHRPEGSEYKLSIHNVAVRDVCFLGQQAPTIAGDEWSQSPAQQTSTTTNLLASAGGLRTGENEVNVSDCNSMKSIHSFQGHESIVMSLHSSCESSNTFVSGSLDGTIRLWDLRSSTAVSIISTKQAQQLSTTNGNGDTVVRKPKREQLDLYSNGGGSTSNNNNGDLNESLGGDGHLVDNGTNNIMQQQEHQQQQTIIPTHNQENRAPNQSPELEHLPQLSSSSSNGGIPVGCVRLDPSGGRLLVSGHQDGSCMFYDIRAGKVLQLFQAHQDEIRTLNFSPKSYYLLTGSYDHKVKLFDLQGRLTNKMRNVDVAELSEKCVQTAWHPYDYNFVTTCANGSATLWTIPNFDQWVDSITID